jgi:hypothetical protein
MCPAARDAAVTILPGMTNPQPVDLTDTDNLVQNTGNGPVAP